MGIVVSDFYTGIVAVVSLSVLAFWRPWAPLFMVIAGMSMFLGLAAYDVYTNYLGLAFGLAFICYSFICLGYTFRVILYDPGGD